MTDKGEEKAKKRKKKDHNLVHKQGPTSERSASWDEIRSIWKLASLASKGVLNRTKMGLFDIVMKMRPFGQAKQEARFTYTWLQELLFR